MDKVKWDEYVVLRVIKGARSDCQQVGPFCRSILRDIGVDPYLMPTEELYSKLEEFKKCCR